MKLLTASGYTAVPDAIADRRAGGDRHLGSIPLVGSLGRNREATYRQIYLTNPWVYAAVNVIARGGARAPLHVFERDSNGDPTRVRSDIPQTAGRPSAGISLDRVLAGPDRNHSRFARWYGTYVDRLVYGNALWDIGPGGSQPTSIERTSWRRVRVSEASDGSVNYYEIGGRDALELGRSTERPRRLAPDEVVHFGRGLDPEGACAPSLLESCRYTLALHEAVVRHLLAYFGNSARLSGQLKVDKLTKERAAEIRQMLVELYTSPENAGKVLVTSGEWQSMSDSPEHSEVINLIRLSREEIAAAFAIPPPVLGILEQAIKSNVKELREQYVRDSVGSWAAEFEEELHAQLLSPWPSWRSLYVEHQLAEQLRPDLEARAEVYQKMKHVLSIDDMRRLENRAPLNIKGVTDVPFVDSGALPVTAFADGGAADRIAEAVAQRLANNGNGNGHHQEVTR